MEARAVGALVRASWRLELKSVFVWRLRASSYLCTGAGAIESSARRGGGGRLQYSALWERKFTLGRLARFFPFAHLRSQAWNQWIEHLQAQRSRSS